LRKSMAGPFGTARAGFRLSIGLGIWKWPGEAHWAGDKGKPQPAEDPHIEISDIPATTIIMTTPAQTATRNKSVLRS
jgi:hypothetical protein